jgi:hypothetical protein
MVLQKGIRENKGLLIKGLRNSALYWIYHEKLEQLQESLDSDLPFGM